MVLSATEANKLVKEGFNPFKYLIVDSRELGFSKYTVNFGWNIELLNLKRYCLLLDRLKLGKKEGIDPGIFDKAITSVMTETPLSTEELKEYFEVKKRLNKIFVELEELAKLGTYPPYEIDYFMLGAGFDNDMDDMPKGLPHKYDNLYTDFLYTGMNVESFIKSAKELIQSEKGNLEKV